MKRASKLDERHWWDLAVRCLGRSEKSTGDIARYLARHGASAPDIDVAIRRLERLGYVNDAAYALRWAEGRLIRKHFGRRRMRSELLRRGFSETMIEATLDTLYAAVDEIELARRPAASHGNPRIARNMVRFLSNRGFSPATIARVLHREIEDHSS
jgi:regulatory protein